MSPLFRLGPALFAAAAVLLPAMSVSAAKPRPKPSATDAAEDPTFDRKLAAAMQSNLTEAEAENWLGHVEQRLIKSPKNQGYLEAVGLLHYRLRRWDNARLHLGRLAKPSARALTALARCHYELGEFRRAADALGKSPDPTKPEATWRLYNLCLQKAGRFAEALKQWEKFRQKHAAPPEALEFLAQAYRRPRAAGNKEKLLPVLEELLRAQAARGGEDPVLLLETAALFPRSRAQAAEYRARYLRLRPDDSKVWRDLAACYDEQKNLPKAAEAYARAVPDYPNDGAFLFRAAIALSATDPDAALGLYAQVLPLLPRDPNVPLELGKLREKLKQPDQALEAYAEALRRAPNSAEVKSRAAALASHARNQDAWLPVLLEAEKKNPTDDLQFKIARIFVTRGDTAQAYKYLDKALAKNPGRREYRQLLPLTVTQDAQILRHFAALETLRKDENSSTELLVLLCRGYAAQNKSVQAVAVARELLRLDPARLGGIRSAVFAAQAAKDALLTLQVAERYLAAHPDDVEVRKLHVAAAVAANAPAQKQRAAIQALTQLDPSEDGWLLRLAELDLGAKDSAAAFAHAEDWTRAHSDDLKGLTLLRDLARGRKEREGAYLSALDRLSRLDAARRPAYEYDIAMHYLGNGELGKAAEVMERIAPQRKDAGFWHRYGSLLQKLGRESAPAFERAWKLEQGNAGYALDFVKSLDGDSALAANVAALKLARQKDNSPSLRVQYARALYFAGDFKAAASEWDDIAGRDPASAVEDSTAILSLMRGDKVSKAMGLLEKRAVKFPNDLRTLALLADLYEKGGKEKQRIQILERLVQEDFSFGDYPLRLAREKEKVRDFAEAVRLYSLWCPRHPKDKGALKAYHKAASASGDSAALLEALRLITSLPDADRALRVELTEITYARDGDPVELEKLTKEFPDYKKGRLLLARAYHARGDFKNLARFGDFLESESKAAADLLEPLADLRAQQGKWGPANEAYFAWLKTRPSDPDAFAKTLRVAREHASPHLTELLRMGTERNPGDLELQSHYLAALGKSPDALPRYEAMLKKRPEDPALLMPAAELAHALGRKDLALRWAESWARVEPDEEKPRRILAELHDQAGDKRALAEDLSKLHQLRGDDREVILRLAKLREEAGQWDSALTAYRAAMYLSPKDKGLRDKFIALVRDHVSEDKATDLLTEIQTLDKGAHETQFELARLEIQRGDPEKAYAYLTAALVKNPRNPKYLALLPRTLQSNDQIARHFTALQELEKNLGSKKSDTSHAHLFLNLARGYGFKKQWEAAAERYGAVLRSQPKLVRGDREILAACVKGKNWPLAAELAEAYLELHPGDKDALRIRAQAYEKSGRNLAEVRKALQDLQASDRENTGSLLRLAEIEVRSGDSTSAYAHLREYLTTHPNDLPAYRMLLPLVEGKSDREDTYVVVLEKLAAADADRKIDAWRKLASFHETKRQFREAQRLLLLLTTAKPKEAALWHRLGLASAQLETGDLGAAAFRKAWELAPNEVPIARSFAGSLKGREAVRSHLAVFKLLDAHAPTPEDTRGLARALLYQGDARASSAAWDRYFPALNGEDRVRAFAENGEAAEAYWRSEQWAKALPYYESKSAAGEPSPQLLDSLQTLYGKLGMEDKRISILQQGMTLDPSRQDFQLRMAQAKEKSGRSAEALILYGQWLAQRPKKPAEEPLLSMRRLADSLQDTAALESALRGLAKSPKPQEKHLCQLAELDYRRRGDFAALERAVRSYPSCGRNKLALAREYYQRDQFQKLSEFETDLASASRDNPEWQGPLAECLALQNKKDQANAAFLAHLRHLRKSGAPADETLRKALNRAWKYAETASSPTLAEVLEIGFAAFPEDAKLAHALGAALGKTQKGLAFQQQWLKDHPEDGKAVPRAAELAAAQGDWSQSREWHRKWTEQKPGEAAAWKGLFAAAEKLGDVPTQVAAMEKLAALQPDDAATAFALGVALSKQGDPERALEHLVRAAELKPGEKTYGREIQNAFAALADAALKAGNRSQAAEWFAMLLERAPDHGNANLYQGLALAQGKECQAAAPLLRKGLAQSAEPPEVQAEGWRELGKCEASTGGKDAGKSFKKALSLNPKDAEALAGSLALAQSGRKEDLPEIYAAALRADSGNAEALAGLSGLRLAASAHAEAAVLLGRLTQIRPDDSAVFADLGKALFAAGGREEAAKHAFARAYKLGSRRPDVVENLVRLHRRAGTLHEALAALEEWLRQNPENLDATAWAAELAERDRDWKQAEEMWARAWQADSSRKDVLMGLVRSTVQRGDPEGAVELLEHRSAQLDPEGLLLLAEAYAAIPLDEKAVETYRKARSGNAAGRAVAGEILVQLASKKTREARNLFEENAALAGDPYLEKARIRFHQLQHDLDKAHTLAKVLAGANPRDAGAQTLWGEILLARRDGAAALTAFQAAEKLDSASFRARYGKGMALLLLNRGSDAAADFFALGEKPDRRARSLGLWGLGEAARKRMREAEAKEYWMQAVSLYPTAQAFSDLAALCVRIRQVDEAEIFAQRALEMKEDFPDAVAALSDAMLLRSQAKDAGEYLEETLRKSPGSCELQLALCRARLALPDQKSLTEAVEQSKRFCPDTPLPWLYSGLAAVKAGKTKDAAAHFARYRQSGGEPGQVPAGF